MMFAAALSHSQQDDGFIVIPPYADMLTSAAAAVLNGKSIHVGS